MKASLALLVLLCAGCAGSNNTAEMDWRHGEVVGTVAGMQYVFEGDEIELNLYNDTEGRYTGDHFLYIEEDEVKYKLKYVF